MFQRANGFGGRLIDWVTPSGITLKNITSNPYLHHRGHSLHALLQHGLETGWRILAELTSWPWSEHILVTMQLEISKTPRLAFVRSTPSCKTHAHAGLSKPVRSGPYYPIKRGKNHGAWLTINSAVAGQHTGCKAPAFHETARKTAWHLLRKGIFTSLLQRGSYFLERFAVICTHVPLFLEVSSVFSPHVHCSLI